ncbi:MAG: chemotaxis protein CheB [Kofleriaceae bacterium]|nr:chemotaxis protein CheB [Kofleriaceae bacterium]
MLDAIAIGGSAGALEPLFEILKKLPPSVAAPVVVVMHVLPNHPSLIPELLQHACPDRTVREPEDKEPLAPRTIYVAPPNYHLLVEHGRTFALSVDDPVNFSRPSIDVLFESAADAFGARFAGVLLSGSNADGAAGLAAIARQGGATIVQADAAYPTMPEAGLHRVPNARALTPAEIRPLLAALESAP